MESNEDFMKLKVELASVQELKAQGDNEVLLLWFSILMTVVIIDYCCYCN